MAEVGSVEVARDPEVRALRACLKRAKQELDILRKSRSHLRPADPMSTYQHIAQRAGQVPVRQLCQVLRTVPAGLLRLAAPPTGAGCSGAFQGAEAF